MQNNHKIDHMHYGIKLISYLRTNYQHYIILFYLTITRVINRVENPKEAIQVTLCTKIDKAYIKI